MRKLEEEQPELHKKLPAKFHPFMSTKFFDKFFPIHYLNVLAITEILQNCFTHHIYPQHVDTNDFKGKSKFTTLDNTYNPFTISLLTFLYPDNAIFLKPYNYDTNTYSVVKLFHQRVGSYFSKKGDEYEARWVKGVFTIMTNPHLTPLDIITCYPILTYDKSVHLKPYNKFHNPKFQPTFDYIDFCTKDYNIVNNNYDEFY